MTRHNLSFPLLGVTLLAVTFSAVSAHAGAISSLVTQENLQPNDEQFFSLGQLDEGVVAFGITTPIAGLTNDFDTPNTLVATFLEDFFAPGVPALLTINNNSGADDNLDDDSLGGLYRFEAPEDGEYTVGVTGAPNRFFGDNHNQSGDYLLTTAEVDPSSLGGDFADTDAANDTQAGADVISLGDFEAKVAVNTLADVVGGDVDYFQVDLLAGDVFTAMTAPLEDDFFTPDTVLFLFDSNGDFILDDDEAGGRFSDFTASNLADNGFGSAFNFLVPEDGTYYVAVTGYPGDDNDLIEPHDEVGDYALLVSRVSVIPEPTSLMLLCLGGLALSVGRKRNR